MDKLLEPYFEHIDRIIGLIPVHKDLITGVLLDPGFVNNIGLILSTKTEQTQNDNLYHYAMTGFPLPFGSPSYCVFEIGVTYSVDNFRNYIISQQYEDYNDYVIGILDNKGKGFDLYETMTGDTTYKEINKETLSNFVFGHILRSLNEEILLMSVLWNAHGEEKGIMVFPPELL